MKVYISQAILAAVLLQFTHVDAAGSCMVDGEVFNYCSNDLDGAWSFENGAVCITEAECKKMTPPNGPIMPSTPPPTTTKAPTSPPTTTTKAPTTGATSCMVDGEVFKYCSNDLDGAWSFENGAVCITEAECKKMTPPNGPIMPSTPPPTTTKAPTPPPTTTTKAPTPPPTTTTKAPTPPPTTTTKAPTTGATSCMVDGEVFKYCSNDLDGAWSFENGAVCITEAECKKMTPPNGPIMPSTPPTTTTKPPTTPTPSGPTQCTFDGEVFPVCKDSDVWSFENGGVCIGAKDCPSTPPTTTTKPPTTPTPSGPTQCTFDGEVFPVCKDSDVWSFENGGVCIGAKDCPSTPPTTTTKPPTTTTPRPPTPTTTTPRPPTTTTPTPPSSGTAALYAQCGGNNYSGPTTCVSGARCNRQNEFYSQCIPDGSNNNGGSGAALWAQCGGIGYSGPTTCVSGARCNKQSDYYSQCIPA